MVFIKSKLYNSMNSSSGESLKISLENRFDPTIFKFGALDSLGISGFENSLIVLQVSSHQL
jgi:hypothetical protein